MKMTATDFTECFLTFRRTVTFMLTAMRKLNVTFITTVTQALSSTLP